MRIEDLIKTSFALVITDQYSRYPEVEFTRSTSLEALRKKLKKVFSTHRTAPQPPSIHRIRKGFKHKCNTPIDPEAQGQVEGFNKLINKIKAIARQDSLDSHEAVYDMLLSYRSTPLRIQEVKFGKIVIGNVKLFSVVKD